jgi:hypothetical protein
VAPRSHRTRGRALLAGCLLVVVLGAAASCASPRYDYVTNKTAGAYMKIPRDWTSQRLNGPALMGIDAKNVSPEGLSVLASQTWLVGIDSATTFDAQHLLVPDATHPKGYLEIRNLLPNEANALSLNDLRNLVIPMDQAQLAQTQALQTDPQSALATPEVLTLVDDTIHNSDGVHGVHLVYQIRTTDGLVTFDQTSLLDSKLTRLYQLVVACSSECYALNRPAIDDIQTSFTVKPTS